MFINRYTTEMTRNSGIQRNILLSYARTWKNSKTHAEQIKANVTKVVHTMDSIYMK